jgi:uncharacterized protein YbjT (DUF2867 family)
VRRNETKEKAVSVLVVGATGTIGSRVTEALAGDGQEVVGLVRNGSRASALTEGVRPVQADLDDPAAVDRALDGIDRVVLIVANTPRQAEQEAAVIDASRRAGVVHLVKLSVGGAAPDADLALARAHWSGEERLGNSGVPFTVVRPGFFMQNLLQYAAWIEPDGTWALPMGEAPISMVHAADVAEVIASVVTSEPLGRDVVVTGGSALMMNAAAAKLSEASGRPILYVDGDPEEYLRRMVMDGNDEGYARDMATLYDVIVRAGYAAGVSDDVRVLLDREPRSFESFASESASVFGAEGTR